MCKYFNDFTPPNMSYRGNFRELSFPFGLGQSVPNWLWTKTDLIGLFLTFKVAKQFLPTFCNCVKTVQWFRKQKPVFSDPFLRSHSNWSWGKKKHALFVYLSSFLVARQSIPTPCNCVQIFLWFCPHKNFFFPSDLGEFIIFLGPCKNESRKDLDLLLPIWFQLRKFQPAKS